MEIVKTRVVIGGDHRLRVDVPVHETTGSVDVVMILQPADKSTTPSGDYNFFDLAGGLQWKGDAVAEQRRLRDEW